MTTLLTAQPSEAAIGLSGTRPIKGVASLKNLAMVDGCVYASLEADGVDFIYHMPESRAWKVLLQKGVPRGSLVEFQANPAAVEGTSVKLNFLDLALAPASAQPGVEWAVDRWMPDGTALSGGVILDLLLPSGQVCYWHTRVVARNGQLAFEPLS